MRVDAHQHFWRLARGDYGWLTPAAGALYRDFEPADLTAALAQADVCATVLVQAAPSEAESHFLFELARAHPFIAGVVGWVAFDAPQAPERIRALAHASGGSLKGLRPMVQDLQDPDWLARPALDPAFEALIESDLVFDALVRPRHLPALAARLRRQPQLRAVLNHAGKPEPAAHAAARWAEQIADLARTSTLHCKLSGLLTEAPAGAGTAALEGIVATLFRHFGPERILWGSDWPVVTLRASYGQWLDLALDLVRRHAPGHEDEVFRHTAVRLYRLDVSSFAQGCSPCP